MPASTLEISEIEGILTRLRSRICGLNDARLDLVMLKVGEAHSAIIGLARADAGRIERFGR